MKTLLLTGDTCYQDAKRKAIKGHRDWIVWRGRDGMKRAAPVTADTMKQALLAIGTQGAGVLYSANDGVSIRLTWNLGLCILSNIRVGFYR